MRGTKKTKNKNKINSPNNVAPPTAWPVVLAIIEYVAPQRDL